MSHRVDGSAGFSTNRFFERAQVVTTHGVGFPYTTNEPQANWTSYRANVFNNSVANLPGGIALGTANASWVRFYDNVIIDTWFGFNSDTGNNNNHLIDNNRFTRVVWGVKVGSGWSFNNWTISSNTFQLLGWGEAGTLPHYGWFESYGIGFMGRVYYPTVTDNDISSVAEQQFTYPPSDYFAGTIPDFVGCPVNYSGFAGTKRYWKYRDLRPCNDANGTNHQPSSGDSVGYWNTVYYPSSHSGSSAPSMPVRLSTGINRSTGAVLNDDDIDGNYSVNSGSAKATTSPYWSAGSGAKWLTPTATSASIFNWITTFDLSEFYANSAIAPAKLAVDNLGSIGLNSRIVGDAFSNTNGYGVPADTFLPRVALKNGVNTINLAVNNADGGITGIYISSSLTIAPKPDLFWRETGTEAVSVWFSSYTADGGSTDFGTYHASGFLPTSLGSAWVMAAVTRLDDDNFIDILWHNPGTGALRAWYLQHDPTTATIGIVDSGTMAHTITGFAIRGSGDFNRDGWEDLVLEDNTTRALSIVPLNPKKQPTRDIVFGSSVSLPNLGSEWSTGWEIKAVGDFSRDGCADIVLRHTNGSNKMWVMNGGARSNTVTLPANTEDLDSNGLLDWDIYGGTDFDNDGYPEILWRNLRTGLIALWRLDGSGYIKSIVLDQTLSGASNWKLSGPK